jgi:hypothetical protein
MKNVTAPLGIPHGQLPWNRPAKVTAKGKSGDGGAIQGIGDREALDSRCAVPHWIRLSDNEASPQHLDE